MLDFAPQGFDQAVRKDDVGLGEEPLQTRGLLEQVVDGAVVFTATIDDQADVGAGASMQAGQETRILSS